MESLSADELMASVVLMIGATLTILLLASIFLLFRASNPITNSLRSANGANGLAGTTLFLKCPTGKTISWENATLVSNALNADGSIGNWSCDPMNFDGSFNPTTTLSAVDVLPTLASCTGNNSCTVSIPSTLSWTPGSPPTIGTSGPCGGSDTQLIATYLCST